MIHRESVLPGLIDRVNTDHHSADTGIKMPIDSPAYLRFDINIYAALLLAVVLITMYARRIARDFGSRLFRWIAIATMVMLLVEVGSWVFDMRTERPAFRILNYAFNWLVIWLIPLVPCLWGAYIDFRIIGSVQRLRRRLYYQHAMVASTIIMAVNFFVPVVFSVSPENVYRRSPGLWLFMAMGVATLLYVMAVAVKNRARVQNNIVVLMLALVTVPILGALLQMVVYGILAVWPLMTIVVVVVYVVLENHNASIDYLTGLYNRLRSEEFIARLVDNGTPFTLMYFDLDDFKLINDTLGHQEGDRTLIRFAHTLKTVCSRDAMVARFGGDEFAVVSRCTDEDTIRHRIEAVRSAAQETTAGPPVKTSAGFVVYSSDENLGFDDVFALVDRRLYDNKSNRKNYRRRKTDRAGDR